MITRLLLATALVFATPAFGQLTSFPGESCVDGSCYRAPVRRTVSRIRTVQPVRRVVRWVTPTRYSSSNTQVVRTYRRGLFGRRVFTGYREVPTTTSYGSSGMTTTYSTASAGSTVSYAAPEQPSLENTGKEARLSQNDTPLSGESGVNCDCDGTCGCPCCPCKPKATKPEGLDLKLSRRLQIPQHRLARQLAVPDLRLASR